MAEGWIETEAGEPLVLRAGGAWLVDGAGRLDEQLSRLAVPPAREVRLDLGAVDALDTVGAWLVLRLARHLAEAGAEVSFANLAPELAALMDQVGKAPASGKLPAARRPAKMADHLEALGRRTTRILLAMVAHLSFFGRVAVAAGRVARRPGQVRLVRLSAQMARVGVSALPIVGLLSFLIGIVLAYQGAGQLRRFGAEIFAADLLGIGFLRELGAMLTAIIVAGRSGSAFTAELGAMQVNEEVDAMRVLGLDPIQRLVLPRFFALVFTLPLLTFYANVMGLIGGALMCWLALGIPLPAFLRELQGALSMWSVWLGVLKAPFFAAAIALTGCYEGLTVAPSAESVGRHTTRSVVESIFLVILLDAGFSILFSWLGI